MNERMTKFYMDIAKNCAKMSRAVRLQVGCIIVKDENIISFSWNGTPAGWDNNCEDVQLMSNNEGWLDPYEVKERWPLEGKFWVNGEEINTRYRLVTKPEVLHAERNSLDKLAKQGSKGAKNACLFTTHSPCLECAKSIYGAGITEVYYGEDYRSNDGIYFLKKCGISVKKLLE